MLNHLFIWRVSHGYIGRNILPPGDALSPVFLDSCYKPVSNTHVQPFQEIYVPKILKLKLFISQY